MPAVPLERRSLRKVWGRGDVPPHFGPFPEGDELVGEVWFSDDAGDAAELLVKYLFTSEKLSIQVHPDDTAARAAGYPRGKDEAWMVLHADPGAVIGLGLVATLSRDALRAAALDGSIEELIHWRPVAAGDVIYSPAGTVHAIGPGLVLVEVQQNVDLTYRLYDYGRPRELHLEDGIAASNPVPYVAPCLPREISAGRDLIGAGAFVLERWTGHERVIGTDGDEPVWLIPTSAGGSVDGAPLEPATVWLARGPTRLRAPDDGVLLLAYPGGRLRDWA